jgi:hypothetical protein
VNDFALELPNPQLSNPPFSAGYSSLTFDSGNASVNWTAKITYQTSGKIPVPAAEPSPAPTPFSTNGVPVTLDSAPRFQALRRPLLQASRSQAAH